MDLVFQVRLTAEESANIANQPGMLDNIAITTAVVMETAYQVAGKPISGEIVDDKGTVLKRVP